MENTRGFEGSSSTKQHFNFGHFEAETEEELTNLVESSSSDSDRTITEEIEEDPLSTITSSIPACWDPWMPTSTSTSSNLVGASSSFTRDPWQTPDKFESVCLEGFDTEMSPATSDSARNQKGVACPHLVKAISMPGIRKAVKGDIRDVCCKSPCNDLMTKDKASMVKWMCLQCGSIGCGNGTGQHGHAKAHKDTPRSDPHCIAVLLQGNLDKAWCFDCQMEMDTNNSFFKDVIQLLRRNAKMKNAFFSPPPSASPAIALGPPPPPPVPKIDPPKTFSTKGKQNNNRISSTVSNSRWDGGDWPLGLENLGNTCFMNSALQCLSRTRSLNDKLDLYASGNLIEILVTTEEPNVEIINPTVSQTDCDETDFVSDECERFIHRGDGADGVKSSAAESSDLGSGELSPSSTEMDSLLDVACASSSSAASRKSEEESSSSSDENTVDKEVWKQELEQELAKPLRLRLQISKDSMAAKLRNCFKAVTRSPEYSPQSDGYERSDFYGRSNGFSSVFCPRSIQLAVSRHFRLGQQHDSHELLRTVVDMMKKDQIKAFRLAIMQRYGVKPSEGKNCDPKVAELLKMWDRKLYHKTFVDEIFGGELVTFQECLQCKSVKRSHEEFLDLSLPIRVFRANPNPTKKSYSLFDDDHDYVRNHSVEDCLKSYTEPEFLTGSNTVECENCHRINLEKLASGIPFEEVFPGLNPASPSQQSNNAKKNTYQNQKKQNKKRQTRQAKLKTRVNQSDVDVPESNVAAGSSLNLIEDHFTSDQKSKQKGGSEDDNKSSKSGSLDDYVVVQTTPMIKPDNKSNTTDMEMDYDMPELLPEPIGISQIEPEGFPLQLVDDEDMMTEQPPLEQPMDDEMHEAMDDLDEPPGDGIGNASDLDDEEGNGVGPLDLGLGFEEKPISIAEYLAVPSAAGGGPTSSTVGDEGFSEGENSLGKQSQSLSGSSSRNSISEADNADPLSGNKTEKKIPVTKCPCSRRQLISQTPEFLTLHLKRFQHTARGSSKLSDKVSFPYVLNLTEFCSQSSEDLARPGFKSIYDEDGEVYYSLYGIVEHSGSLHFGHYVAYVKQASKQQQQEGVGDEDTSTSAPTNENWFYISDSHVSKSSLDSVLSQDAYILFYERIRGPEKKARLANHQDVEKDVWPTRSQSSYNYSKPATEVSAPSPSWDENWDQQDPLLTTTTTNPVSSSNDMPTIVATFDSSSIDAVSSSTVSYDVPYPPRLDGVSSTTMDSDMDYTSTVAGEVTASSATLLQYMQLHPLWSDEAVQGSAVFGNIADDNEEEQKANNPVSSTSDSPNSKGYSKLEEVD